MKKILIACSVLSFLSFNHAQANTKKKECLAKVQKIFQNTIFPFTTEEAFSEEEYTDEDQDLLVKTGEDVVASLENFCDKIH